MLLMLMFCSLSYSLVVCFCDSDCSSFDMSYVSCEHKISKDSEYEEIFANILNTDQVAIYLEPNLNLSFNISSFYNHTVKFSRFPEDDMKKNASINFMLENNSPGIGDSISIVKTNSSFNFFDLNICFFSMQDLEENAIVIDKIELNQLSVENCSVSFYANNENNSINSFVILKAIEIDIMSLRKFYKNDFIFNSISTTIYIEGEMDNSVERNNDLNSTFEIEPNKTLTVNVEDIRIHFSQEKSPKSALFKIKNITSHSLEHQNIFFFCDFDPSNEGEIYNSTIETDVMKFEINGKWPPDYMLSFNKFSSSSYGDPDMIQVKVNTFTSIVPLEFYAVNYNFDIYFIENEYNIKKYIFGNTLSLSKLTNKIVFSYLPKEERITDRIKIEINQLKEGYVQSMSSFFDFLVNTFRISSTTYINNLPFSPCFGLGGMSTFFVNKYIGDKISPSKMKGFLDVNHSMTDDELSPLLTNTNLTMFYINSSSTNSKYETKIGIEFIADSVNENLMYVHGFHSDEQCFSTKYSILSSSEVLVNISFFSPKSIPFIAYDSSSGSKFPIFSDEQWTGDIANFFPPGVKSATFVLVNDIEINLSAIDPLFSYAKEKFGAIGLYSPEVDLIITTPGMRKNCQTTIDFGVSEINYCIKSLLLDNIKISKSIMNINVQNTTIDYIAVDDDPDNLFFITFSNSCILSCTDSIVENLLINHIQFINYMKFQISYNYEIITLCEKVIEFSANSAYVTKFNISNSKYGFISISQDISVTGYSYKLDLIADTDVPRNINFTFFSSKKKDNILDPIAITLKGWRKTDQNATLISYIKYDNFYANVILSQPTIPQSIVFVGNESRIKYEILFKEEGHICVCDNFSISNLCPTPPYLLSKGISCDTYSSFEEINEILVNTEFSKVNLYVMKNDSDDDIHPTIFLKSFEFLDFTLVSGAIGIDPTSSLSGSNSITNELFTKTTFSSDTIIFNDINESYYSDFNFSRLNIANSTILKGFEDTRLTAVSLNCSYNIIDQFNSVNIKSEAYFKGILDNGNRRVSFIDTKEDGNDINKYQNKKMSLFFSKAKSNDFEVFFGIDNIRIFNSTFAKENSINQNDFAITINMDNSYMKLSTNVQNDKTNQIDLFHKLLKTSIIMNPFDSKLEFSDDWDLISNEMKKNGIEKFYNNYIIEVFPYFNLELVLNCEIAPINFNKVSLGKFVLTSNKEYVGILGMFSIAPISLDPIFSHSNLINKTTITFYGDFCPRQGFIFTITQSTTHFIINKISQVFALFSLVSDLKDCSSIELLNKCDNNSKIMQINIDIKINDRIDDFRIKDFIKNPHMFLKVADISDTSELKDSSILIKSDKSSTHGFNLMPWKFYFDNKSNSYFFYTNDDPLSYPFILCYDSSKSEQLFDFDSSCEIIMDVGTLNNLSLVLPNYNISVEIKLFSDMLSYLPLNFGNCYFDNISITIVSTKTSISIADLRVAYVKLGNSSQNCINSLTLNKIKTSFITDDNICFYNDQLNSVSNDEADDVGFMFNSLTLLDGAYFDTKILENENISLFDNLALDFLSADYWQNANISVPLKCPVTIIGDLKATGGFDFFCADEEKNKKVTFWTDKKTYNISPNKFSKISIKFINGFDKIAFRVLKYSDSTEIGRNTFPIYNSNNSYFEINTINKLRFVEIGPDFNLLDYKLNQFAFISTYNDKYESQIQVETESYPFYIGNLMSNPKYIVVVENVKYQIVNDVVLDNNINTNLEIGTDSNIEVEPTSKIERIVSFGNSSFKCFAYYFSDPFPVPIKSLIVKDGSSFEMNDNLNPITNMIVLEGNSKTIIDISCILTQLDSVEFHWSFKGTPNIFVRNINFTDNITTPRNIKIVADEIKFLTLNDKRIFDDLFYQKNHKMTNSFNNCNEWMEISTLESLNNSIKEFVNTTILHVFCSEENELTITSLIKLYDPNQDTSSSTQEETASPTKEMSEPDQETDSISLDQSNIDIVTSNQTDNGSSNEGKSNGKLLSDGEIIGIVIAITALLTAGGVGLYIYIKKRKLENLLSSKSSSGLESVKENH